MVFEFLQGKGFSVSSSVHFTLRQIMPERMYTCIYLFILFYFLFWLCRVACGILAPRPGIKPEPPAWEVWSLNHWTAREVLNVFIFE